MISVCPEEHAFHLIIFLGIYSAPFHAFTFSCGFIPNVDTSKSKGVYLARTKEIGLA